jgi:ABC-type nitrate/sulfonate/bicarbonate transport system substrate-binding protein
LFGRVHAETLDRGWGGQDNGVRRSTGPRAVAGDQSLKRFLAAIGICLAIALITTRYGPWAVSRRPPPVKLRICMPRLPFTAAVALARQEGLFLAEGLDVEIEWSQSGKASLDRLASGGCDLVVCRETPLALAVMRRQPVTTLASIATSEEMREILVRRDRGVMNVRDLAGRRVGCVPETSSDYVLDAVLDYDGMGLGSIDRVTGSPEDIERAMLEGRLDAASIWAPISDRLLAAMEGRLAQLDTEVLSRAFWNLVGRGDLDQDIAGRALRAIAAAGERIAEHPQASARQCSAELGIQAEALATYWQRGIFTPHLDQALILALESCARWALLKGYLPPQEVPNFLHSISPLPLAGLDPTLVTVVHPAVKR